MVISIDSTSVFPEKNITAALVIKLSPDEHDFQQIKMLWLIYANQRSQQILCESISSLSIY